jgi:hypothetical protein
MRGQNHWRKNAAGPHEGGRPVSAVAQSARWAYCTGGGKKEQEKIDYIFVRFLVSFRGAGPALLGHEDDADASLADLFQQRSLFDRPPARK